MYLFSDIGLAERKKLPKHDVLHRCCRTEPNLVANTTCRVFPVSPVRAQLSNTNIAIKTDASREKTEIDVRKQQCSYDECGSGKVSSSQRRNNKADGNLYSRYGTWFMRSSWWLNRPVAGCLRGGCSSAETTLHTPAPFPPQLACSRPSRRSRRYASERHLRRSKRSPWPRRRRNGTTDWRR